MTLISLEEKLGICQLPPDQNIPEWAAALTGFSTISRTRDEISIVCNERSIPEGLRCDKGWRGFKLVGQYDFSLTGILKQILDPLAEAKIGIFAISTFDTDYVLVKEGNFEKAKLVLAPFFEVQ